MTVETLPSPSGATLCLYATAPQGAPKAVVQVNHGLAEHAARYGRFAAFLAARGIATFAHDHRGHGGTTAPDAPPGSFKAGASAKDAAAAVLADVDAGHAEIARRHPGVPVIVFGHSMGGLIALNHALAHPWKAAGLAIWNTNFTAGLLGRVAQAILAFERMRLGSDVPSRVLPALTFRDWAKKIPNRRTDFDWLSRDAAEVEKYIVDPLCGFDASVGMWQAVLHMVFAGASDANLATLPRTLPLHLTGGTADPATANATAVRDLEARLKRLGFGDVTTRIREGVRHETLNETNRDEAMADFAEWVERIATSPVAP